jgi:hypothetical protein
MTCVEKAECRAEIDATIDEDHGQVFMHKHCAEHGSFRELLSADARFFKRMLELDRAICRGARGRSTADHRAVRKPAGSMPPAFARFWSRPLSKESTNTRSVPYCGLWSSTPTPLRESVGSPWPSRVGWITANDGCDASPSRIWPGRSKARRVLSKCTGIGIPSALCTPLHDPLRRSRRRHLSILQLQQWPVSPRASNGILLGRPLAHTQAAPNIASQGPHPCTRSPIFNGQRR